MLDPSIFYLHRKSPAKPLAAWPGPLWKGQWQAVAQGPPPRSAALLFLNVTLDNYKRGKRYAILSPAGFAKVNIFLIDHVLGMLVSLSGHRTAATIAPNQGLPPAGSHKCVLDK